MPITRQNPLLWLLLLLTAWACLAAPQWGAKTASGNFYGRETASGELTGWEAAPRLGFGGLEGKSASVPLVGANSEIVGPYSLLSAKPEIVGPYSPIFRGETTRLVNGVVVVDRRSGTVFNGTVDLGPTIDRIEAGGSYPHRNDGSVFQNRAPVNQTSPLLPVQSPGYYTEYVVPTPNTRPGPQRIITGKGGDMYYTPDHYDTFIPLKSH